MKKSIVLSMVLLMLLAGTALAQEFPPWGTYGQVSADRVLSERLDSGYFLGSDWAPYTEPHPLAFGTVCSQCSPDRALSERVQAGYASGPEYAPYDACCRYEYGTVTTQVSPDRVMADRMSATTF